MTPAENQLRLKNYLIDSFVCAILTCVLFGISTLIFDFTSKDELFVRYFTVYFLTIRTIYYIVFEFYFFRTIGKAMTKTKVRTTDDTIPGFKTILIRSLSRLIPLNAFSFLLNGDWHDRISGTYTILEEN